MRMRARSSARGRSETAQSVNSLSWREAWRRPWTWAVAMSSLSLLSWVLWRANLGHVWSVLKTAEYRLVMLGIPTILGGLVLRALRWRILVAPLGYVSWEESFGSLAIGYLANNVLPARAGELVRSCSLARQTGINAPSLLATIIVERVLDGLLLLAIFLSIVIVLAPTGLNVHGLLFIGGGLFLIASMILLAMRNRRGTFLILLKKLLTWLPTRWQLKGTRLFEDFLTGLTAFRHAEDAVRYLAMSVLAWTTDVMLFWLTMRAFGIVLPLPLIVFVMIVGSLSTSIPALPGYVGTYQFALVSILTALGVGVSVATAFALTVHAIGWSTINLLGLLYAVRLGIGVKRLSADVTSS